VSRKSQILGHSDLTAMRRRGTFASNSAVYRRGVDPGSGRVGSGRVSSDLGIRPMRCNQVLGEARGIVFVFCALVAILLSTVGFGGDDGAAAAVHDADRAQVDKLWSARLGDEPPPYYECYPSFATAAPEFACFQDPVECSGSSSGACTSNFELTMCQIEEDAVVGIGEVHTGTMRLQVKGCEGTRLRFQCVWYEWQVGEEHFTMCSAAVVAHDSVNCGGVKRVKVKGGCVIED